MAVVRGRDAAARGLHERLREGGLLPDAGLTIFGYVAEAGSRSEQQLQLLADWTAPHTDERRPAPADHEGP